VTRPLRICVVAACPLPFPRGTPIRAARLSEALAASGHEVDVVTYGAGVGALDPAVRVHRIRQPRRIDVSAPGPSLGKLLVLDPRLAFRLRRLRRERAFDLVHAHHYEGLLVARAAARELPIAYDAHTVLETELPAYAPWVPESLKRRVGRTIDERLPRWSSAVIAVSDVLRDHLVSRGAVDPERIEVVGNGVETEARPRRQVATDEGPDGGVVVYAGNLAPYQGIEFLLEAFRLVLDQRPASRLRILTESRFDRFESLARDLGIRDRIEVRAVPPSELHDALGCAHVAVNPRPRCDGVPQKNLNYMAACVPLVAFAGSLHPCRDGVSGLAVPSVSGEALGSAILHLLGRPAERSALAEAARAEVERDFTWAQQAARVTSVYERMLGRERGARKA
jgi:glycosyltransferase involved in cell wall biosynthesis